MQFVHFPQEEFIIITQPPSHTCGGCTGDVSLVFLVPSSRIPEDQVERIPRYPETWTVDWIESLAGCCGCPPGEGEARLPDNQKGGPQPRLARGSSAPFPPPGLRERAWLPARLRPGCGHVIELPPMTRQKSCKSVLCLVPQRSHLTFHCLLPSVPHDRQHKSLRCLSRTVEGTRVPESPPDKSCP